MKILLVGGAYQGKRAYAERTYAVTRNAIHNGETIHQLHLLVRSLLEDGKDAKKEILQRLEGRRDWVVICDEIGAGVIPMEKFDREWREATGRLCIRLAQQADVVERVSCGIPVRLKG